MKKLLSALLAAGAVLSALPLTAAADGEATDDTSYEEESDPDILTYEGFDYKIETDFETKEKGITIYSIPDGDRVEVPNEIDGLPVRRLKDESFFDITTLVIPPNVTYIPPSGRISGCAPLKYFEVSEDNTAYTSIDGILYNKDITELYAVPNGTDIDKLVVPETVTTINWGAINGGEIKHLVLPEGLENIEYGMFTLSIWSSSYESIEISEKNKKYYTQDGVLFSRDGVLILYPPAKKDIEYFIPEGTKKIYKNAFKLCQLKSIHFPEGFEYIEWNSIRSDGLNRVYLPASVEFIGKAVNLPTEIYYGGSEDDFKKITTYYGEDIYVEKYSIDDKIMHYNAAGFPENKKGDADGSGNIDASDASFALVEYARNATGEASVMLSEEKAAADVNGDGLIDAKDATDILGYYSYVSVGGTEDITSYKKTDK